MSPCRLSAPFRSSFPETWIRQATLLASDHYLGSEARANSGLSLVNLPTFIELPLYANLKKNPDPTHPFCLVLYHLYIPSLPCSLS